MANLRCPNCGGYDTRLISPPPSAGETFGSIIFVVPFLLGYNALMALILAVVVGFLASLVLHDLGWWLGLIVAIAMLWGALKKTIEEEMERRKPERAYEYVCNLCKYTWDERRIDRTHQVTTRPDLIIQGRQREEERRRSDIEWDSKEKRWK